MYFITTAVMFALFVHSEGLSSVKLLDVLQNLLFMTTGWFRNIVPYNIPAWFFSVIMLLYILFWVIERILKKYDIYAYVGLIVLGLILMKYRLNIPFLYQENGLGYVSFSVGVLLYFLTIYLKDNKNRELIFGISSFICIVVAIVLLTVLPDSVKDNVKEQIIALLFTPGLIIMSLMNSVNNFMDIVPKISNAIADSALNLYLWHLPVVRIFNIVCLKLGVYDLIGYKVAYILSIAINVLICYEITQIEKIVKKRIQK